MTLFNLTLALITSLFLSHQSMADSPNLELQYPELMVTPRATQRLLIEAKKENAETSWYKPHKAIFISSLMTLSTGLYLKSSTPDIDSSKYGNNLSELNKKEDELDNAISINLVVGSVLLGSSIYFSKKYEPYQEGWNQVAKLPHGSKREDLTRERLAEEQLREASRFAKRFTWISVAANSISNIILVSSMSETKDSNLQETVAGMAVLTSFLPLFFEHPWVETENTHESYKKKIYGPIAQPYFKGNPQGGLEQGVMVSLRF